MWRQDWNNRKIVRPTPAVPNTTCVIIRSLTAMTTIDISLSVELMCYTERAIHVPETQGTRYVAHTWQFRCFAYSFLDILWRLTHLLLSPDYFKNTATNTKIINILFFLYTGRIHFIHYSLLSFLPELLN